MFVSSWTIRARQVLCIAAATAGFGCSAAVEQPDEGVASVEAELCASHVPPELAVPDGNKLAFDLDAVGVQMYTCKAAADGTLAWAFVAPDADLFGKHHHIAGSHYAGPTWESVDGSTVVGAKLAGVTVDASAVPWLLLQATAHTGTGKMANVTYVQRLSTTGGLAPTTGCDHAGATANVDYTATYYFYKATKTKP